MSAAHELEFCPACNSEECHDVAGPQRRWCYRRCACCGHQWLRPVPTEADLTLYYNSTYAVPQERYRDRVDREFPFLERLLNQLNVARGRRLLEIGCSYGNMLAQFAAAGWDVEGIEVDARAVTYARDAFGLVVHQGMLDDARRALRPPYDLIAMYHVIEHVWSVERLADSVASLLAPSGLLVLKTPNAESVASRVLQGWWEWSAAPEHVHLFTSQSLRRVLLRAGFETQLIRTRRGDARGILHELLRASARRLVGSPPRAERLFEAPGSAFTLSRPISQSPLYSAIARLLDGFSRPLDWMMDRLSTTTTNPLQPELLVVARRTVTST